MSGIRSSMMLLAFVGLCVLAAPLSEAATSGSYRCLLGVAEGGFATINHHNPNSISQKVTRVRAWNSAGQIVYDSGTIAFFIPANGSDWSFWIDGDVEGFLGDEFQVLVNWSQSQDKPAPIPRVDMFPDGTLTSALRTPCP